MPMFKTIGSGTGSCKQVAEYLVAGELGSEAHEQSIQRYLAGDASASRALVFGSSPDINGDQLGWHEVMRATRARWGKDVPPPAMVAKYGPDAGKHWRTYYHWTISPAPADHASAAEVGDLAREWLETAWPASDGWQWIYSVHADNAGGIMHAHIVLNAVNALTGRKAHIDRDGSDRLADQVQEIAGRHGMGVLPLLSERRRKIRAGEIDGSETGQAVRMSPTEIAMRARGVRSWVAEIRDEIDGLAPECRSFGEFVERMEADGFSVERSRRGLGFRHPESCGSDKKILATKLGLMYTESGLRSRIGCDIDRIIEDGPGPGLDLDRRYDRGVRPPLRRLGTEEWLERQFRLGPRRSLADTEAMIDAIATARAERVSGSADLRSLLEEVACGVMELKSKSDEMRSAVREVSAALDSARDVAAAREELSRLPDGAWNREVRTRRNLLLRRVTDGEIAVEKVLSRSLRFIESADLSEARDVAKLEMIMRQLEARLAEVRDGVQSETRRLDAITSAASVMDVIAGRRVRPVRAPSAERLVPDGHWVAVRVRTTPPHRSAYRRSDEDLRAIGRMLGRDRGVRVDPTSGLLEVRPAFVGRPDPVYISSRSHR